MKKIIDRWIEEVLSPTDPIQEAALYALEGGKRVRPSFIIWLGQEMGQSFETLRFPAIALEFFHTASLIADDFPCMDDSVERRGRITCHSKYGLSTSLLASYFLIAKGYEVLNLASIDPSLLVLSSQITSKYLEEACIGQHLDLTSQQFTESSLREMIQKKTGVLFELGFSLAWVFSKKEIEKLPFLQKIARHFGLAFQIADDLLDLEEDATEKNIAYLLGKEKAEKILEEELLLAEEGFKTLGVLVNLQDMLPGRKSSLR